MARLGATLVAVGMAAQPATAQAKGTACCWCDPKTPAEANSFVDSQKTAMKLIFSDEFEEQGRNFANGHDTKWTALNIGDTSNQGAAYYLPQQASVVTDIGDPTNATLQFKPVSALQILTENEAFTGESPTGEKGIYMPSRSAMLQSWNKFCFTGGVVEFRARQPRGGGYWPALWLFGNLGRAVYQNSNTGLWPWSYSECDGDLRLPPTEPPQRISACDDRDLETEGLNPFQGRGATELDVLEGAVSNTGQDAYVVGSLQLSPGVPPFFKPYGQPGGFPAKNNDGSAEWYKGLTFGAPVPNLASGGFPNNGWYGPPWGADCPTGCPDALSGGFIHLSDLDTRYWTYRMEWKPGPNGHISWWYDGAFVWAMAAEAFGEYSVCSTRSSKKDCWRTPPRMIPEEPMSIVMNTAIGTWNGGPGAIDGKHWPARFFVDYVRVWQAEENIGCNPPDFPTKVYIEKNHELYGEPVSPLGYDTCPEKYPPKSHAKMADLHAKAHAIRSERAAKGLPQHVAERAASIASYPGVTTSRTSQAPVQAQHPTKVAMATAMMAQQSQLMADERARQSAAAAQMARGGQASFSAYALNALYTQPLPPQQQRGGFLDFAPAAEPSASSMGSTLLVVGVAAASLLAVGLLQRRAKQGTLLETPWPRAQVGAYRAPPAADAEYVAYGR